MTRGTRCGFVGAALVAAWIGAGCVKVIGGEGDGRDVGTGDATLDGGRQDANGPEVLVFDWGPRDGLGEGIAADAIPDPIADGLIDAHPDGATLDTGWPGDWECPGGPGCPCERNEECIAGFCVEAGDRYRCTRNCQTEDACPRGWRCGMVGVAGGVDVLYVCVDPFARLCQPCEQDSDCVPGIGAGDRRHACIPQGREGSFCGVECTSDSDCPDDFKCAQAPGVVPATRQCLPLSAKCECTPKFRIQGNRTRCSVTNAYGTCRAERTCDQACPAAKPEPETCNGMDDNCNGTIDEGTDGLPCKLVNVYGTCTGASRCVGGHALCEGTPASQELCNGIDDDCDGQTDERDAIGCKVWYRDTDGDGFGATGSGQCNCRATPPYVATQEGDCDDARAAVHPGAIETCNGLDDDCDGQTDEDTLAECFPTVCDPARGGCKTWCDGQQDCQSGTECVNFACRTIPGVPCKRDDQCAGGFCTDGVCCSARCNGVCESCALPGRVGQCTPIPPLQDPDDECTAQATSTCGATGFCSGNRSCALHPAGTPCAAPSCIDGATLARADLCDGAGSCRDGGMTTCAPATCDAAAGACRQSCVLDPDCLAGYLCVAGRCARDMGRSCVADGECASGLCTDGVCCRTRCGGTCEACNLPGRAGFCDPVPDGLDPDDECPQESASGCRYTGACSGARTCRLHPAGTVCIDASCASASTSNVPDTCNGAGLCVDNGTRSCLPFACNPATGRCGTSCAVAADCAAGYVCQPSTGQCLKSEGQACSTSAECQGGTCCSGFCRDLQTDRNHCGSCGTVCRNEHGATSCVAGVCRPTCDTGWGDCDASRSDGCETSLRTVTDCGKCKAACVRTGGVPTCETGTCGLAQCDTGFASCDANDANGCELDLARTPNTCATAEWIGSNCGDTASGVLCPTASWRSFAVRSGRSGHWFRARVEECSDCCADVATRITLTVPTGVDYDLYVYSACGSLVASSTGGPGATEQVTVRRSDDCLSGDTGFDYEVEVRFNGGSSCEPWILGFDGTTAS